MKKALLGLVALATALAVAPMFAAFEAHVINVTAKIENALAVTTNELDFGTVFPQEHLALNLGINLSRSFLAEDRVDDVEYFIRQKPKCGVTTENGEVLLGPTATGHVSLGPVDEIIIDCGPDPRELDAQTGFPLPLGSSWGVLPSLCEYISKDGGDPDGIDEDGNDGNTPSFHQPWTFVNHQIVWLDTPGRLAKSEQDITDNWIIDLSVPCFGGYCAQDWEDFVHDINPQADPDLYTQPIGNEHKIFGCDLWVEVSEVSESATITIIKELIGTFDGVVPGDFQFTIDASPVSQNVAIPVTPDVDHTLDEVLASGFQFDSISGAGCPATLPGVFNLSPGEDITCTVTNTSE